MLDVYTYINDIHLNVGETKRTNCPNCNGYNTFTVTNNMGRIVWNCYKVSCGIRGTKKVNMDADDLRAYMESKKVLTDDLFEMPSYLVPVTDEHTDAINFAKHWQIDHTDLWYDVKEHRVVFLIHHNNSVVDATGRSLTNRLPKWKRYGNSSLPFMVGSGKTAVVVEDCVSAAVVGNDARVGVALLGTSLTAEQRERLTQFSTAIIALDPDAIIKSLAISKELRGYVDNVRVLKLTDDLKYRNPEDMQALIELENPNGTITNQESDE